MEKDATAFLGELDIPKLYETDGVSFEKTIIYQKWNLKQVNFYWLVAAVAMTVVVSQTNTITAADTPTGNAMYIFAEGVYPQATFTFRDATVSYDFQAFTHTSNLFGSTASGFNSRSNTPEFTLQRIVGNTPILHEAVDQTFENNGKTSGYDFPYKTFDVEIEFIQSGESLRTLVYKDCSVSNYKISAEFDKEEGYVTGKTSFVQLETYTFACNGYYPNSPTYDQMVEEQQNRRPYQ